MLNVADICSDISCCSKCTFFVFELFFFMKLDKIFCGVRQISKRRLLGYLVLIMKLASCDAVNSAHFCFCCFALGVQFIFELTLTNRFLIVLPQEFKDKRVLRFFYSAGYKS